MVNELVSVIGQVQCWPSSACTIEVPASLRSENCSPSARNAVRVPSGISVRLRRNPQLSGVATRSGCVKAASYLSKTIPTEGRIGNIERKDG